jgi:hypothetical protein
VAPGVFEAVAPARVVAARAPQTGAYVPARTSISVVTAAGPGLPEDAAGPTDDGRRVEAALREQVRTAARLGEPSCTLVDGDRTRDGIPAALPVTPSQFGRETKAPLLGSVRTAAFGRAARVRIGPAELQFSARGEQLAATGGEDIDLVWFVVRRGWPR